MKRIGVAISDERKKIAITSKTIPGGKQAISDIQTFFKDKSIELILLGLPLLLSGKSGDMAEKVKAFGKELEETLKIPVRYIDERFTSRMADRSLKEICLNRKERSAKIDESVAMMLLQDYLNESV